MRSPVCLYEKAKGAAATQSRAMGASAMRPLPRHLLPSLASTRLPNPTGLVPSSREAQLGMGN